jgi:O-antigen/teichoic acid export membrane protein
LKIRFLFRERLEGFGRPGFIRSVGLLVGGTAVAQGVTVAALPLLTRLYSPRDLALLAVYVALVTIASIAVALRFEIALPLPEKDAEAANLLAAALSAVVVVSGVITLVLLSANDALVRLLKTPELRPYLWLVPVGVFFTGCSSVFQYWATRKRKFARVARARMIQSSGGVTTQLLLGFGGFGGFGLIVGQVVNAFLGSTGLAVKAAVEDRESLRAITLSGVRSVVKKYHRFPKFSTLDSLSNVASLQLPVLFIAARASGGEAGFLLLAMRVMQAPMTVIGAAVSQVYLSRAAEEDRQGNLPAFTGRVLNGLLRSGVGPLLLGGVVAPWAFVWLFGIEWKRAGELVMWMTPWFVLQFLVSPVSMVLHVRNRQRDALTLNVFGLAIRLAAVVATFLLGYRHSLPEALAVASAVFYAAWLSYCLKISGVTFTALFSDRSSNRLLVIWLAAGVCVAIALHTLQMRGW